MSNAPIYINGRPMVEVGRGQRGKKRVVKRIIRRQGRQDARLERLQGDQPGALITPKLNLSKVKIFPLGVIDMVAAGATEADFTQTAQNMFEPIRGIAQAETSLDDVELTDINVGNVSQVVVKNVRFPAQMLSPQADDVLCDLDIVTSGIDFSVSAFNMNAAAQRVTMGYFGNYFQSAQLR